MKISILTPGITPYVTGGLQRHSFNLVNALRDEGIKVDLYSTDMGYNNKTTKADLSSYFDIDENILIPWQKDIFPGHYIRSLKKFSKKALSIYLNRDPADYIIAKSLSGWAFTEAKLSGLNLPRIGVNFHGYEMFQSRPNIRTKIEAAMLRGSFLSNAKTADDVFSYGAKITDVIKNKMGIPMQKIIEIPGGTDPALYRKNISSNLNLRKFIFMGRFERRKGIQELNKVIQNNPQWNKHAEFSFIGPIPKRHQINMSNVNYYGEISDDLKIQNILSEHDILICPSYSEGMPNVIMEAMAAGLAIISTDVGAVNLLVSRSNGILLPNVELKALENSIQHCISISNNSLKILKNSSSLKIQDFFWPEIGKKTIKEIEKRLN